MDPIALAYHQLRMRFQFPRGQVFIVNIVIFFLVFGAVMRPSSSIGASTPVFCG